MLKMKSAFDEIVARDKTSLDITWLKDKPLADLDNLPDPDVFCPAGSPLKALGDG